MSLRVSVVVPTYRRPALLSRCLEALTSQRFPAEQYEILVVDDAGAQDTRALVQRVADRAAGRPSIRYLVASDTQGPAAARNLGWKAARGAIIAFTDDDCQPEPGWLGEGVAVMQEGFDGLSGGVIVPVSERPTDHQRNTARLMTDAEFVTANCFYRRSALNAVGGFDEDFRMAWREDSELYFRMLKASFKLGKAPKARVIHPARAAPWGNSIREQRKSMYNALLYKKFPDLYRERIQPLPPVRYYLILVCALVALGGMLAGQPRLALAFGGLWLLLTLEFAFQRLRNASWSPGHVLEMLVTSALIPPLSIFWRLAGAVQYRVLFL